MCGVPGEEDGGLGLGGLRLQGVVHILQVLSPSQLRQARLRHLTHRETRHQHMSHTHTHTHTHVLTSIDSPILNSSPVLARVTTTPFSCCPQPLSRLKV